MIQTQRIIYLLAKYKSSSLSSLENEELKYWRSDNEKNEDLFRELLDQNNQEKALNHLFSLDTESSLEALKIRMADAEHSSATYCKKQNHSRGNRFRISVAASILVALTTLSILYFQAKKDTNIEVSKRLSSPQIIPGGNRALLTLADGTTINLDEVGTGTLSNHDGLIISKAADGQLIYTIESRSNLSSSEMNTISTPRGGQYQVALPDGTRVWLNASSSLSYPVVFNAKERKVVLSGEAYFDVTTILNSRQQKTPFIIELGEGQSVEVLGTELNVQAYKEERINKTTLIEGRVNIRTSEASLSLVPGQQGKVIEGQTEISVSRVEVASVAAWKNGYFHFEEEPIQEIMSKIARWYDVDLHYEGKMPNDRFGGVVSRFDNVSELLSVLELTGKVHFKVEGRRITVMP